MLVEAQRLAAEGRAIYVVVADETTRRRLRNTYSNDDTLDRLGIKFETWASLPSLDTRHGTLRAAHPNCVVLVDHFAVESRLGWLLEQATRFDLDAVQP